MLAAALFASSVAIAQTSAEPAAPTAPSKFTKCLTGGEMNSLFQSGRAEQLPNYTESAGARVQRQYPKTRLYGQAKHSQVQGGGAFGICEYSNHIGIVAVFYLYNAQADAYDRACDDGSCHDGDYWRSDWRKADEAEDKPGQEMIKACYRDINDAAFSSAGCGFTPPVR